MICNCFYQMYIWIKSYLLKSHEHQSYLKNVSKKRIRQRYRRYQWRSYINKKVSNLKWCVSYSVFDGEELLEPSILAIRDEVDHVQVLYQVHSWTGTHENKELPVFLNKLKEKGLIDELIEFKSDFKDKPWHNELKKRNIGLTAAKKAKCDYFMTMDTDEFYFKNEFHKAKHEIVSNGITHSYAMSENYGLKPTEKIVYEHTCCVPFFSKVRWFSRLGDNKKAPCLCDPTRMMLNYPFTKHYLLFGLSMQHMKRVRKDLLKKIVNSSAYDGKKRSGGGNLQTCIVEDVFNILPYLNDDK